MGSQTGTCLFGQVKINNGFNDHIIAINLYGLSFTLAFTELKENYPSICTDLVAAKRINKIIKLKVNYQKQNQHDFWN